MMKTRMVSGGKCVVWLQTVIWANATENSEGLPAVYVIPYDGYGHRHAQKTSGEIGICLVSDRREQSAFLWKWKLLCWIGDAHTIFYLMKIPKPKSPWIPVVLNPKMQCWKRLLKNTKQTCYLCILKWWQGRTALHVQLFVLSSKVWAENQSIVIRIASCGLCVRSVQDEISDFVAAILSR